MGTTSAQDTPICNLRHLPFRMTDPLLLAIEMMKSEHTTTALSERATTHRFLPPLAPPPFFFRLLLFPPFLFTTQISPPPNHLVDYTSLPPTFAINRDQFIGSFPHCTRGRLIRSTAPVKMAPTTSQVFPTIPRRDNISQPSFFP